MALFNANWDEGNNIRKKDDLLKGQITGLFIKGYENLQSKIYLLEHSSNTLQKGNLGTNRLRQQAQSISAQSAAIYNDFISVREAFNRSPQTVEMAKTYGEYLNILKNLLRADIITDNDQFHPEEIITELKKWKLIE